MPARTVEEHIEHLLSRSVAEGKVSGTPRPDLEAASVFDSIALNLMLKPRAALYFALLARNGLLAVVRDELSTLTALQSVISDLGNSSFKIEGAPVLRRAYSALLNLETLPSLDSKTRTTSISVSLYGKAVSEFLNNYLAKNVKRRGSTSLLRSGQEASQDLPAALADLRTVHEEMLDRLYALATGIGNFDSAPFGAVLGTATVSRARADLEEIISFVESGGEPSNSRDFAVRLIGSKAAITTISQPPHWGDALLPEGTVGTSGMAAATAVTSQGPFSIVGNTSTLSLDVCGTQGSFYFFPGNSAILVGSEITFPLTVPAGYGLFLATKRYDGANEVAEEWRLDAAGTYANLAALISHLSGQVANISVAPFAGTPRLMFYSAAFHELSVQCVYQYPEGAVPGITVPTSATSMASAHAALGFSVGQTGTELVPASYVAEAIGALFPSLISELTSDGTVRISTVSTTPGAYFKVLSAPASLGLSGTYYAMSSEVVLVSTVSDQRGLVQVGDELSVPDASSPGEFITAQVADVTETAVTLSEEIPTFSGAVSGSSAVVSVYKKMNSALQKFLVSWGETPFTSGVSRIDKALAPLTTSQSPVHRNMALAEISPLVEKLTELLNLLGDDSTMLPAGAGQEERKVVEGILTTLAERHYLRAADLLLKCDLQSILSMDVDQASYGGAFLAASSNFVRNNIPPAGEEAGGSSNSVSY